MNDTAIGIIILFLVSLVVRVLPSFVNLPLSKKTQDNIKNILPIAVFLNLLMYCVVSELKVNPKAASYSLILLLIMLLFGRRIGIFPAVLISSAAYFTTKYFI
jgi:hypothetical protein